MDILVTAFIMGLFSSLHCVVMCGPLMTGFAQGAKWWFVLKYQLGRIFVYGMLGLAAGLLGSGFAAFSAQKNVALFTGLMLLVGGLCGLAGFRFGQIQRAQAGIGMALFRRISPLQSASVWPLLLGMLNGLIPCGMVYAALAAAINTGQPGLGWQFMIFFGAGTLPLTLALMGGAQYLKGRLKIQTARLLPVLTVLFGLLLLLRAADLRIPYFSPHHAKAVQAAPICR
ncbi:sulfite exporter TauE/SafE family protein [Pedobacter yulinensis]|uniref:Sulfite exporter TauE/SafE family protein n=1 Tax=Pedobacter yulinensis TaxID=2126353 RepID=A0A2T3HJZ3_9SPHI|nr:sulfite exporter TauE/SafE family protein [Pedobacter yulinensis]PST82762.1 sulfite exporter TauE/SafE family protein [Pedobacter yulinensis]